MVGWTKLVDAKPDHQHHYRDEQESDREPGQYRDHRDRNGVDKRALEKAREVFARINSVLDVVPESVGPDPKLARWVEEQLTARKDARARRDFAQADAIRAEIEAKGIAIEDAAHGTTWKVR